MSYEQETVGDIFSWRTVYYVQVNRTEPAHL